MTLTVMVWDVNLPGQRAGAGEICVDDGLTTARALIEARVRREVAEANAQRIEIRRSLVPLTEAERMLNGEHPKLIEAGVQVEKAMKAFLGNAFLLFVDGEQLTDLDAPVALQPDPEIEFVRLVPLVGG